MNLTRVTRQRLALAALLAAGAAPCLAQQANSSSSNPNASGADETVVLNAYTVTGERASLATAQEIKRDNQQVVDSIIADDINKLPDVNTAEALERITGIQVGVNTGEIGGNGGIELRGLTQIENLIDGREQFTAGGTSTGGVGAGTRTFDYSSLPSALVGGIDVYKTSEADQPEGGLGGLINVRMHQPFDFPGFVGALTVGTTYSVAEGQDKPTYDLLVSDVGRTPIGKIGVLVNIAYSLLPYREDQIGLGNVTAAPNSTVAGYTSTTNPIYYQNGYNTWSALGNHTHLGINAEVQWQANKNLMLYAGTNFQDFWIYETEYEMSIGTPTTAMVPGSGVLFPGSTNLQSVTFSNVVGTNFGIIRNVQQMDRQYFVGGKWQSDDGNFTVDLDVSRSNFTYGFYNNAVYGSAAIPGFVMNTGGSIPSAITTGASLLDPSIYKYVQVYNRLYPTGGYQTAGKLDAELKLPRGFFSAIKAGVRMAGTEDDNGVTGLYLGAYNVPANQAAYGSFPGQVTTNPVQNFFDGYRTQNITQYLVPVTAPMQNAQSLNLYGDTTSNAKNDGSINPLSLYHIDEGVYDGYVMAKFMSELFGKALDGNVGIRFAHTVEDVRGFQSVINSSGVATGVAPLVLQSSYNDLLPSLNSRLKLTDSFFVRFAVSRSLTRPQFSQLSPSLTLNPNPITPANDTGAQGNPELKPIHSTNFDVSVEKYLSKDAEIYVAGFTKSVTGFALTTITNETYGGLPYQISRPSNLNTAQVRGVEMGTHYFFDFLPEPFNGLGIQGNFTHVDSSTPTGPAGYSAPLTGLSRNSYNLIGIYEKGPASLRIAWNWRSRFFNSVTTVGSLVLPSYTEAYGELDASFNYQLTKNLSFNLSAQNINNALRTQYLGTLQDKTALYLDGANFLASVTIKL